MLIFVALVLIGFFYVWKKGALDWSHDKPSRPAPPLAKVQVRATSTMETIEAMPAWKGPPPFSTGPKKGGA
jgi:hypothetical protein